MALSPDSGPHWGVGNPGGSKAHRGGANDQTLPRRKPPEIPYTTGGSVGKSCTVTCNEKIIFVVAQKNATFALRYGVV